MHVLTRLRSAFAWLAALTAALTIAGTITASAALAGEPPGGAGAVFVQTNDIAGNAILAYARSAAGALTSAGRYPILGRDARGAGRPPAPPSRAALRRPAAPRRDRAPDARSINVSGRRPRDPLECAERGNRRLRRLPRRRGDPLSRDRSPRTMRSTGCAG